MNQVQQPEKKIWKQHPQKGKNLQKSSVWEGALGWNWTRFCSWGARQPTGTCGFKSTKDKDNPKPLKTLLRVAAGVPVRKLWFSAAQREVETIYSAEYVKTDRH